MYEVANFGDHNKKCGVRHKECGVAAPLVRVTAAWQQPVRSKHNTPWRFIPLCTGRGEKDVKFYLLLDSVGTVGEPDRHGSA